MKKTLRLVSLLLALVMLTACLASCSDDSESSVPSGMKLASGEDCDYIMYVPEDWRVDKSTLYTAAYYSSTDATSISATAYGMNYGDTTADDWFEGFMEEFKTIYTDVSSVETEDSTLGGVNGKKFTFSGTLNEQVYNYTVVAAIRNNYIYYITYTSTPQYYSEHLEALDDVVRNFAFK